MKDFYLPVPGRTPTALFNKAESIDDLINVSVYMASSAPSSKWRIAEEEFLKAILCFVFESYAPEDRDIKMIRSLLEMELEDGENGESRLCELMKARLRFAKENHIDQYCTVFYSRFNSYPKAMKRAIAVANLERFGFNIQTRQDVIFF